MVSYGMVSGEIVFSCKWFYAEMVSCWNGVIRIKQLDLSHLLTLCLIWLLCCPAQIHMHVMTLSITVPCLRWWVNATRIQPIWRQTVQAHAMSVSLRKVSSPVTEMFGFKQLKTIIMSIWYWTIASFSARSSKPFHNQAQGE